MRQSIVFTATKRDAEALAVRLQGAGHAAAALHGDMNQRDRTRTLSDLKRGGVRTLVATDVAARGIDIPGLTHVINFDLPRQAEDYVHRIGRTGRAGRTGAAISFVGPDEHRQMKNIERFTGNLVTVETLPGLEPSVRPRRPSDTGRPAGRNGAGAGWRSGSKPAPRSGGRSFSPR
jgi:superfamily II DNA/RNA helicase